MSVVTNKIVLTEKQLEALWNNRAVELWQTDSGRYIHLYARSTGGRKVHVSKRGKVTELDD